MHLSTRRASLGPGLPAPVRRATATRGYRPPERSSPSPRSGRRAERAHAHEALHFARRTRRGRKSRALRGRGTTDGSLSRRARHERAGSRAAAPKHAAFRRAGGPTRARRGHAPARAPCSRRRAQRLAVRSRPKVSRVAVERGMRISSAVRAGHWSGWAAKQPGRRPQGTVPALASNDHQAELPIVTRRPSCVPAAGPCPLAPCSRRRPDPAGSGRPPW